MYRVSKAPLLVFSVALLLAADPSWKTKPSAQWTEADAKQLLAASPWVKVVVAGVARPISEDELRAGGEMGEHHGVGYDGVQGNKPQNGQLPKSVPDLLFGKGPTTTRLRPGQTLVQVRWESALPVRIAELKAEAEAESIRLRGQADADADRIRNEAQAKDPEFYSFLKKLEDYQRILGDNKTTLLLSTHREMFDTLFQPPKPMKMDKKEEK